MKWRLIHEALGERTFVVVLEKGDEIMERLRVFSEEARVTAARFNAIGALSQVRLGFFDTETREYLPIEVNEQVEVLTLVGNVALQEGKQRIHAHIVVGKRDGSAHGGHLLEAKVRPTLEIMLVESPHALQRHFDRRTGLAMLSPE